MILTHIVLFSFLNGGSVVAGSQPTLDQSPLFIHNVGRLMGR